VPRAAVVLIAAGVAVGAPAAADRAPAALKKIAALAPADDARRAVVIGVGGEVYEPDGKGAWVHRLQSSTADPLVAAGRAGRAVIALGGGVVYRLSGNGWSAIRLVQHGKAILGTGVRSLAAVGRQLFALDQLTKGEPTRLAVAPGNIVAIGAGARAIVVATEAGLFRLEAAGAARPVAVRTPAQHLRIVSDHWAVSEHGAVDLTTAKLTGWPSGLAIGVAATAPDDALVAIGASRTGLELVTLRGGKLAREPVGVAGTAVGVVVDRASRAVIALDDGRIALRDKGGWTMTAVTDEAPAEHPGAPPATSE